MKNVGIAGVFWQPVSKHSKSAIIGTLPCSGEAPREYLLSKKVGINFRAGFLHHCANVAQVLIGTALLEKFKFPQDDIFGWRKGYLPAFNLHAHGVLESPAVEGVSPAR